jgi:hypothetical protein
MRGRNVGILVSVVVALMATGCRGGGASHARNARSNPVQTAVGGLELDRAVEANGKPTKLARECAQAATRAGFPIACPTALPRGSHPFWGNGFSRGECDPGTCGPVRLPRWTWLGTYFSIGTGLGHVVVASAPRVIDPRSFIYLVGTITPHPSRRVKVVSETTVMGHAAKYVSPSLNARFDPRPRVGGIVFMGQTVLIWAEHGHTYAIGVAGRRIDARSVEAAIAHRLTFITPPSA